MRWVTDLPDDDPWDDRYCECANCHRSFLWTCDDEPGDEELCGPCEIEKEDALFDDAIERRLDERRGQ